MQLYLIRHAQSQNNAKPEEQRVEDPGLTELGDKQARLLAEWIPTLKLTRLFSSPFRRALLTAEPVRKATSLAPAVLVELHEKGGCYGGHTPQNFVGRPGMTRSEIEQAFPEFNVTTDFDGKGWWGSKPYESWDAARERAARLFERTRDEFAGTDERVGYVMHADFKLLFLEHIHAELLDVPYNTSVSLLRITRTESRLEDFNRAEHLSNDLVTW
ncbi:MAG: histidine phosphatase family protein [Planctomycetes bacterium]|nr:histidine phosphatase family protein [Planctomycetota bacterium]